MEAVLPHRERGDRLSNRSSEIALEEAGAITGTRSPHRPGALDSETIGATASRYRYDVLH